MPQLRQAAADLSARAWIARLPAATAWLFAAAWAAFWWSLKRHICDCYFLPAESAGPAPFPWLAEAARRRKPRLESDSYGRWRWRE